MGRRRFGAIRKLPSGRWQARYRDETGRYQTAPHTFPAKADADRWLANVEREMMRGTWVDPRGAEVLLEEWAEHYIATAIHLKPKTVAGYESLLRSVILPRFGTTPIGSIRTMAVRRWVADLDRKRGLSASRIRQAYNLLRAMLDMAIADGFLAANPCAAIKLPRLPKPDLRYLTAEQVAQLAAAMPEPFGLFVDVLAFGGLRFGEAAALRRKRIDLEEGRLIVAEAVSEVNGKLHYATPKSHRERAVVLPASIVEELADHLEEHVVPTADAFLFTASRGGPLRYSVFMRNVWRPAAKRAGMPGVTPHVLRHTAATLLIDAGASVKDVQQHLGHADASVTLNIYSGVMEGRNEELAIRLERLRDPRGRHSSVDVPEGRQKKTIKTRRRDKRRNSD